MAPCTSWRRYAAVCGLAALAVANPESKLVPAVHWEVDRSSLNHLIPQSQHSMYYAEEEGIQVPYKQHKFLNMTAGFQAPTVILEHSEYISDVACSESGIEVSFNNHAAFKTASRVWPSTHDLLLATNRDGCSTSGQKRSYWRVHSAKFEQHREGGVAHITGHEATLREGINRFDLNWGSYVPKLPRGRVGTPVMRRRWSETITGPGLSITLTPSPQVDSPWGAAYQIISEGNPVSLPTGTGSSGIPASSGVSASSGASYSSAASSASSGYSSATSGYSSASGGYSSPSGGYSSAPVSSAPGGYSSAPASSQPVASSGGGYASSPAYSQPVASSGGGYASSPAYSQPAASSNGGGYASSPAYSPPAYSQPGGGSQSGGSSPDQSSGGSSSQPTGGYASSGMSKRQNNGVAAYCVGCNVNGNVELTGAASFSWDGVDSATINMNGQMAAQIAIGLQVTGSYSHTWTAPLGTYGLPFFSVEDIITVGPSFSLSGTLDLSVQAAGQALAGGTLSIGPFQATMDFINTGNTGSSGFTPQITSIPFQGQGQIGVTATLGLPVSLGVGVDIIPIDWNKSISLNDKPAIVANANYGTSGSCANAISYDVTANNDVYLDFFGADQVQIAQWTSPSLASGCFNI